MNKRVVLTSLLLAASCSLSGCGGNQAESTKGVESSGISDSVDSTVDMGSTESMSTGGAVSVDSEGSLGYLSVDSEIGLPNDDYIGVLMSDPNLKDADVISKQSVRIANPARFDEVYEAPKEWVFTSVREYNVSLPSGSLYSITVHYNSKADITGISLFGSLSSVEETASASSLFRNMAETVLGVEYASAYDGLNFGDIKKITIVDKEISISKLLTDNTKANIDIVLDDTLERVSKYSLSDTEIDMLDKIGYTPDVIYKDSTAELKKLLGLDEVRINAYNYDINSSNDYIGLDFGYKSGDTEDTIYQSVLLGDKNSLIGFDMGLRADTLDELKEKAIENLNKVLSKNFSVESLTQETDSMLGWRNPDDPSEYIFLKYHNDGVYTGKVAYHAAIDATRKADTDNHNESAS